MARPAGTYAIFETSQGNIVIRLLEKEAPKTVENFIGLAEGSKEFTNESNGKKEKRNFYDGLTFHRVVANFVVQGGDPKGDGTGGPLYKLPNETNSAAWVTGSLGMASSSAGVSGSQFFIVTQDAPSLATSGVYNHFGMVTSGMDVVGKIQVGDKMTGIDITAS